MRSSLPVLFLLLALASLACRPGLPAASEGCVVTSDCPLGRACREGRCVSAACPDSDCAEGERCVDGQCLPTSCAEPCADREVCVAGRCVDESCALKSCAEGSVCIAGECYPPGCGDEPCGEGLVCSAGECVAACVGAVCGLGQACRAGECVDCSANETSCGDGLDEDCDGLLDCADEDCEGLSCKGDGRCFDGRCLGPCEDERQGGDETDTDCGGDLCPPCGLARGCLDNEDCESGNCVAWRCVAVSCSDGLANGSETDVDCGGDCDGCAPGKRCKVDGDCDSGLCAEGQCSWPSCGDGVRNGTEADVDCGGRSCPACPATRACEGPQSCESGVCVDGLCAQARCDDSEHNGDETDLDCGAGCPACLTGERCAVEGDCAAGLSCIAGLCLPESCANQQLDADETAVDCGGSCGPCVEGMACRVDSDCLSQACVTGARGSVCAPARCDDGRLNGAESDVDCGGQCVACSDGKACRGSVDCVSGVCTSGRCAAPLCTDGVLNGTETDVDCGERCPGCGLNQACVRDTDCRSLACEARSCVALASCREIHLRAAQRASDGRYPIDPDGAGGHEPVETRCLMSFAGGGWTLVQRTVWSPGETAPLRTGYSAFWSTAVGASLDGRGFRLPGRWWPLLGVETEHLVVHRARTVQGGGGEPLYYTGEGLWRAPAAGGARVERLVQEVPIHNAAPDAVPLQALFSANDDGPGAGYLESPSSGVPWTYAQGCQTCPVFAGEYFAEPHPMASYLTTNDARGRSLATVCGDATPVGTEVASDFVGVDSMEYFLR